MTDFDNLAASYIATWNETDAARRGSAIEKLWAEDGSYVDPLVSVQGRDRIDATIAAAQTQFPSFEFRLVGRVDGHHDQCRFTWELGPPDSEAPVVGFDVALVDGDGKLRSVLGFLDRVPAQ